MLPLFLKKSTKIFNPFSILWFYYKVYPLEHVTRKFAFRRQAFYHLVENGRLAFTIDTAKDIDLSVKVPHNVSFSAPKRLNLYLPNVVCVFLHNKEVMVYLQK